MSKFSLPLSTFIVCIYHTNNEICIMHRKFLCQLSYDTPDLISTILFICRGPQTLAQILIQLWVGRSEESHWTSMRQTISMGILGKLLYRQATYQATCNKLCHQVSTMWQCWWKSRKFVICSMHQAWYSDWVHGTKYTSAVERFCWVQVFHHMRQKLWYYDQCKAKWDEFQDLLWAECANTMFQVMNVVSNSRNIMCPDWLVCMGNNLQSMNNWSNLDEFDISL